MSRYQKLAPATTDITTAYRPAMISAVVYETLEEPAAFEEGCLTAG